MNLRDTLLRDLHGILDAKGSSRSFDGSVMVIMEGPRCCGKSTQARRLSKKHGWLNITENWWFVNDLLFNLSDEDTKYIMSGLWLSVSSLYNLRTTMISDRSIFTTCYWQNMPIEDGLVKTYIENLKKWDKVLFFHFVVNWNILDSREQSREDHQEWERFLGEEREFYNDCAGRGVFLDIFREHYYPIVVSSDSDCEKVDNMVDRILNLEGICRLEG